MTSPVRQSRKDLEAIQKRALAEGVPDRTLIASVSHKYAGLKVIQRDAPKPSGCADDIAFFRCRKDDAERRPAADNAFDGNRPAVVLHDVANDG